jgi:DNA polymerase III delta subunit
MQLIDFQKQITSKGIDKCLLLFGEETAIMDIYLSKIYKTLDVEVVRPETMREAFSRMTQKTLDKKPRCFVVRDDMDFFKDEKIWARVFNEAEKGKDYLIVIYSSMDKRSKFYKQHTEKLIEFAKLNSEMLSTYIDKLLPGLDAQDRIRMAEICDCSYSRILLECDKVKHFVSANKKYDNQSALEHLITSGVIYQPIGDITFKFTDAILTRNFRDTGLYLQQARQKQEPEIMVLSILYNSFKQILMVQGLGRDQSDACKRTGLTAWQVKLAKEKEGHYTLPQLVNALKVIRFVEKGIKTGQIDSDISLEYAIINIM